MSDFRSEFDFAEELRKNFYSSDESIEISAVQHYKFEYTAEEDKRLLEQWRDIVGSTLSKGKRIIKLQACAFPINTEIRELILWVKEGMRKDPKRFEDWRFVTMSEFKSVFGNWEWNSEFWLFDDRSAILMPFDSEGRPKKKTPIDDESKIKELSRIKKELLLKSLKPAEFVSKYL